MTTALLVVDMQNGFFRETAAADKLPRHLPAINRLIERFRDDGLPIVLARTVHKRDGSTWTLKMRRDNKGVMLEGSADAADVDGLVVPANVLTVVKTRHSAFVRTNLEAMLRVHRVHHVVLCGIFLEACVGVSAADAAQHDFRVTIARQATMACDGSRAAAMLSILEREFEVECRDVADICAGQRPSRPAPPARVG
jgi:nicotinamidase-related amidase